MVEYIPVLMFAVVCLMLMAGYPVAFSLAGTALIFAMVGTATGHFDMSFLHALPNRLYGTIDNTTLIAVPLFVLMGVMLEKSRLAEDLLDSMALLFGKFKGGLGISVVVVGMLLAASTGIVGATVVAMGLMSLPTMLKRGYHPALATGSICATGTLGQIIPPSIALVLLGDILSSAYQQAQLGMGIFNPKTISIGDLFVGAIVPGLLLVTLYILYLIAISRLKPELAPVAEVDGESSLSAARLLRSLLPPVVLIVAVLGSILSGAATPTEAAGVGAMGATLLALGRRQLTIKRLRDVTQSTTEVTAMVFLILIGAAIFSLIFRGFGGEELMEDLFTRIPGGVVGATLVVMVVIFLLGFILDFIEITFVVVPIVGPILLAMGLDPVWLGIMIAINLQTSFLTPPFGFALFYLRGVAPPSVATRDIYRGVVPFIIIQLLLMLMLAIWPSLATWLPSIVF
ncbi:TRAP transporter large permease [Porticoccus hydrocarbonoclasticus]|jgi:tripartite ATP-independent transporter DctM subunit|uniref:TRAP transporter large permease n=1 Tax=Porticoccus hydrocarbonoclasticus TaxID=1073414 RepID=UPI0005649738|nr:TRAP transporter large permease subunit [Porticoccus hydrocarbonoclasticus]|tara:strand:- start:5601 stop:6971 length:1371 start_codon:yes stop_codon:yes gene_type:complete